VNDDALFTPTEDGAVLLDEVHAFLGHFVVYPSEHAHVAHTLWVGHTHRMERWDSTPRIAFLSPEPGSGKTRALEVTEPLVPRPVQSINVTAAYLFRKVSDPEGPPTLLYDEIDTVFGPKAKDNEEVRGLLNAGHRRGAVAGRCVVKGKAVFTEELPAYCAVALAGLNDLPDTIMSRSVVVRMRKRAPGETVEEWRPRLVEPEAHALRDRLAAWAQTALVGETWPEMPPGIADRDADVWEALLAVADAAGGAWPARARAAAVALVAESRTARPSLGVQLLADLRTVFGEREVMSTGQILEALHAMPEAPWADLRGRPLNPRGLATRLRPYGVSSTKVRTGDTTAQGYRREDLWDAWRRYLPPEEPQGEGDVPDVPERGTHNGTQNPHGEGDVPDVPDVPLLSGNGATPGTEGAWRALGRCPTCQLPLSRGGPGESFCRCECEPVGPRPRYGSGEEPS
jgi:hypothetical protein